MKNRVLKIIKCSFLLFFVSNSCRNDAGEPATPRADCVIDTIPVVSFSKNIIPIFNSYCTDAGCHSGTNPAAKLSLEASVAYSQLMKKGTGYVNIQDPGYSILYSEMNSTSDPMPPTGRLDACTIALVYKWIQQQAKNN